MTDPTNVPDMIDALERAILNSHEPAAHEFNVQTLADLARRLHMTAVTYRDIAELTPEDPS